MTVKEMIDPTFGPMTFRAVEGSRGWWTKQEHLDLMGSSVALEVDGDAGGPAEARRQVYRTFKRAAGGLRAELQEALFAFYGIMREQYAAACGDIEGYAEEFLPELQSSDEVWGLLTPLSWVIVGPETAPWQGVAEGVCDTLLSWHGCWDVEHEFSALYLGERLMGIEALGTLYGPADLQPSPG